MIAAKCVARAGGAEVSGLDTLTRGRIEAPSLVAGWPWRYALSHRTMGGRWVDPLRRPHYCLGDDPIDIRKNVAASP